MNNDADKSHLEALLNELDAALSVSGGKFVYRTVVESVERPLIEKVLKRTFGNQLKAAKILGIHRNTLKAKIVKFGIDPERWKI